MMKAILVTASLLAVCLAIPGAAAAPEPPECYDRQPIVDGVVVEVWLTRGCSVRLVVNEPTGCIMDLCV